MSLEDVRIQVHRPVRVREPAPAMSERRGHSDNGGLLIASTDRLEVSHDRTQSGMQKE